MEKCLRNTEGVGPYPSNLRRDGSQLRGFVFPQVLRGSPAPSGLASLALVSTEVEKETNSSDQKESR